MMMRWTYLRDSLNEEENEMLYLPKGKPRDFSKELLLLACLSGKQAPEQDRSRDPHPKVYRECRRNSTTDKQS